MTVIQTKLYEIKMLDPNKFKITRATKSIEMHKGDSNICKFNNVIEIVKTLQCIKLKAYKFVWWIQHGILNTWRKIEAQ